MDPPLGVRRPGLWLGVVALVAASAAAWLFPRALPILSLDQRLSRQAALQRADSFFRAHDLAPDGARTAVRFDTDDALRTYLELAGGGPDTVNAVLRGTDVALFTWRVRAFVPQDPHEARVSFAPDGRVVGFRRVLAEADPRPDVGEEGGLELARQVLTTWLGESPSRWRLATSSYETLEASGRVDRTYTFERTDRRIADAPLRLDVVIAGDLPAQARPYVEIPESFERRYDEMRSANDLLAILAQVGMLGLVILGALVLRRYAVARTVRWRPAMLTGGVIGALGLAAQLNQLPGSWFGYDTATSPEAFQALLILQSVLSGAGLALLVGLTLAAAEAATREAFPHHLDWWKAWRHRGTRHVAGRVASGYVVALMGLAYVQLFYLVARSVLGWWVPSELLDDPNLISTPLPWLSGVAVAAQAGLWEELLFRALPLSVLAIWARNRPHRNRWMAAGVVVTALVFGFAHANYPSWPPYSRGVEIFLDACLWAVLFLWLGLLVTVLAHFAYNLVLFGLFAASGTGLEYRITAAVILVALLAPALAVLWSWIRQRGLTDLPAEARFGAWRPPPASGPTPEGPPVVSHRLTSAARRTALAAGVVALLGALLAPAGPRLGPPFTAKPDQVLAVADSVARARGVDPGDWRRLTGQATEPLTGWSRFLVQEGAEALADTLARSYQPAAWWAVRYVHTGGTAADRAEEWRIRIWPDGALLDLRHLVPDSARGDTLSDGEARRIARLAIAGKGLDTLRLQESEFEATERPARRDVTVTYTDTTVALPGDATARVHVTLAGDEPLVVRRSIDLPESFQRAERERQSRQQIIVLLWAILFASVLSGGVVLVIRRSSPVLDDEPLDRRRSVALVGALAVTSVAAALNSLPSRLFAYPTAMPWSNWVGTNAVGILMAVVMPLLALAVWLLVSALRRRVAVRFFPEHTTPRGRDVLLAGVGLGAVLTLFRLGLSLAGRPAVPGPPSTSLDLAVPLLGQVLFFPLGVAFTVALLAVPGLAVAGISSRRAVRALMVALLLAPLVALTVVTAPAGGAPVVRGLTFAATVVAGGWMAARFWAPYCAWSWVVAGLVDAGFGAARTLAHAPTGIERGGGLLALAAIAGLVALAARVPHRPSGRRPEGAVPGAVGPGG